MKTSMQKYVPTDMDWYGNYAGNYCLVGVSEVNNTVFVRGTGGTAFYKHCDTLDEALSIYNRLTYIQSFKDLQDFNGPGVFLNGRPRACPIAGPHWADPVRTPFTWPGAPLPVWSD